MLNTKTTTKKENNGRSDNATSRHLLTRQEVERIGEKLGVILEYDHENVALLMLLLDHLDQVSRDWLEVSNAIFAVKQKVFMGTAFSDKAQQRFQKKAFADRVKLLQWPYEQQRSVEPD